MNALDDYQLYFEKYPLETKELLVDSNKRSKKVRALILIKRAEAIANRIPSWRPFKRLERLESKVDKPWLHESGLKHFIQDEIAHQLGKKRGKK